MGIPIFASYETVNGESRTEAHPALKQTDAEISAGVTPVNYAYAPYDIRRYGGVGDGVTDATDALQDAIDTAAQAVSNGIGARVTFPPGEFIVSSMIVLPNRVGLRGASSRGTSIKAAASHPGPFMFEASNGGLSMFGSILEDLQIDANNVVGLGCIHSKAWQENSGPRRCVILNFRTYGILYTDGELGASYTRIEDTEIFASLSALAAIRISAISIVGNFKLHIIGGVLAGSAAHPLPAGLDVHSDSTLLEGLHFEDCDIGLNIDGPGFHTLITCDGSPTGVATLVDIASTFTGDLRLINCRRGGATNFLADHRAGGLGTITSIDYSDLRIDSNAMAHLSVGSNWCAGYFDGTAGSPTLAGGYNVASITKNATGDYTVNMTIGMPSAGGGAPWANCNNNDAIVRVDLASASSFRIRVRVAGVLTDSNEVKFGNVRLTN